MRFDHTILQVVPKLNSGGAERTTLEITKAVVRAGGKALVATRGGRLSADIIKAGGEVIDLPVHSKNPLRIWMNAQALARIIRERNVDLIHARSRAPAWSSLLAARRMSIPFVTTYHGAFRASGAIKRWYNSSLVRGDRVIANSGFTADAIRSTYRIDETTLKVIPRGVDLDIFDPAKVAKARVNQLVDGWKIGANAKGLRVLLPGRLTQWKGHAIAIEAAALLKSQADTGNGPDLTLVFCGGVQNNSDYEQVLRAEIDERGVREMVHLVGDCADMPAAYCWSDIVIAPSVRPEAFGRVAVEAGAMRKPVIAAAHGGAMETVVDGESGVLVAPGDAQALANAIAKLEAMPHEERDLMGEKGRARATSVYSSTAMCDATLRIYEDLLSGRG